MAAPSGPPDPIKPALELYGELLLEAGPTGGSGGGVRTVAATHAEPDAVGESHGEGARAGTAMR